MDSSVLHNRDLEKVAQQNVQQKHNKNGVYNKNLKIFSHLKFFQYNKNLIRIDFLLDFVMVFVMAQSLDFTEFFTVI